MKNIVIFFLFIFAGLIGNHFAKASDFTGKISYSALAGYEQNSELSGLVADHDYRLTFDTNQIVENSFPISIEDDEENEDVIKKHISQVKYFLAFCYAFTLNNRSGSLAERIALPKHLSYTSSCKYILQRALRI
jgi:hypothetical protein